MRQIKFRKFVGGRMIQALQLNSFREQDCDFNNSVNHNPMQFIGIKDSHNIDIYECDICDFGYLEDGFERSNCGKIMNERGIQTLRIVFYQSEFLSLDFKIFFVKDGKIITNKEWYEMGGDNHSDATEKELVHLNEKYYQSDSDLHFIRYISSKPTFELKGNIHQNSDLL